MDLIKKTFYKDQSNKTTTSDSSTLVCKSDFECRCKLGEINEGHEPEAEKLIEETNENGSKGLERLISNYVALIRTYKQVVDRLVNQKSSQVEKTPR